MFTKLTGDDIGILIEGELGINSLKLLEITRTTTNGKLIDLGVETGKSSRILLDNAIEKNNHVWGVDPIPAMGKDLLDNPNYHYVCGDSYVTGMEWKNGPVDLVFIDSIHAKEQVLAELYAWWQHVKVGGWMTGHDTNWANYIHKPTHPCAGKKPGNSGLGYDYYGGVAWETPDKAFLSFFNIPSLDYEDEFIKVEQGLESLGMVFIQKKQEKDYRTSIADWNTVFARRNHLLKSFG